MLDYIYNLTDCTILVYKLDGSNGGDLSFLYNSS